MSDGHGEPQLYMWVRTRERVIARHDFYMEQMQTRLLANFDNIEGESDKVAEEAYDRIGAFPWYGQGDMSVAADIAHDEALDFYMLLAELKRQTILGALAGIFHQWDKDLRDFLESELRHSQTAEYITKKVWMPDARKLLELLKKFGWKCADEPFYEKIEAVCLIVNVHKHGKGRSLDDLRERFPHYLNQNQLSLANALSIDWVDHDWLQVSEADYLDLAAALRAFWVAFPERLFLKTGA